MRKKETIAKLKKKIAIMETINTVFVCSGDPDEPFSDYILDSDIAVSCEDGQNLKVINTNRYDNNYIIMTLNIEYLCIGQMANFILAYMGY